MTNTTRFYGRLITQTLDTPHNIISIGEPLDGCQLNECHTNVLRLLFDDIEYFVTAEYTLFSADQARLIINWLHDIPENSLVIVHCESGVARSAAVVKFMVDVLGYQLDPDRFCKGDYSLKNRHVYDTLVTVYQAMEKQA